MFDDGGRFFELVEQAPRVWHMINMYVPSELGGTSIRHPALTPDGLRLVYVATVGTVDEIMTATRDTNGRFVPDPGPVFSDPTNGVNTPYLTADCKRLYFSHNNGAVDRLDF